jgi:hypothetical protein
MLEMTGQLPEKEDKSEHKQERTIEIESHHQTGVGASTSRPPIAEEATHVKHEHARGQQKGRKKRWSTGQQATDKEQTERKRAHNDADHRMKAR